jgi:hypothetical protein
MKSKRDSTSRLMMWMLSEVEILERQVSGRMIDHRRKTLKQSWVDELDGDNLGLEVVRERVLGLKIALAAVMC